MAKVKDIDLQIKEIETTITGLKKDLQHLDESKDNIYEDITRNSQQYKGAFKAAYVKMETDNANKKIAKLNGAIMGQIMNLTFIKEQLMAEVTDGNK